MNGKQIPENEAALRKRVAMVEKQRDRLRDELTHIHKGWMGVIIRDLSSWEVKRLGVGLVVIRDIGDEEDAYMGFED